MTVLAMGAIAAGIPEPQDSTARSAVDRSPVRVGRLAAASVAVVVAMHVSGIFVAGRGSYTRCLGWPLWEVIAGDLHPWLQTLRLGLAGLGAMLIVSTVVIAVRSGRTRRGGLALLALFSAEMVLGLILRVGGLHINVAAAYSVLAAALIWCLALLAGGAWVSRVATVSAPKAPVEPLVAL